jgi:RHS repeat-associated protein
VTTNDNGAWVGELRYKAWGETRYVDGTTPTDYRFTGQKLETATGLYDYGARYYDPVIGRFIQADTIVPDPGDPQSLNRYSYVLNNPVKYRDPSGHAICLDEECRQLVHPITLNPIGGWDRPPPPPGSCSSVVCLPTATPTPTSFPMFGPMPYAGPWWEAATPTPYAGPWMGPGAPLTPTPTPHPYVPAQDRVNVTDTYWNVAVAFAYGLPELAAKHSGTAIRAGGRAVGHVPPGILEGVGFVASVGPNVYKHRQQGGRWFGPEMNTDLIVDAGGWLLTLGTTPGGTAVGGVFGGAMAPPAGGLPGAVVGYIAGSVGVSIGYDMRVAPAIRPWVRGWFGN